MTLPASPPITMAQIAAELGLAFPVSLSHSFILALAGKSSVPISMSDLLGKTGSANFTTSNSYAAPSGSSLNFPFGFIVTLWGGTISGISQDQNNNITLSFATGSGVQAPSWNGNFKFTDVNTGETATLTKQNATLWGAVGQVLPPSNVTHTYTLFPV